MSFLLEPLQHAFMLRGLAAALTVSLVCAVVGSFMVLRGMAFFGDALAHAILPGVAVAYLVAGAGGPLFWGALGAAIATALGIGVISRSGQLREDTAIGVVFTGVFALGIALISSLRSYSADLTHILFGDILAVTNASLLQTVVFGVGVLLVILACYKELVVVSFDPTHAAALRLPLEPLRYLLLILIAVTVVVALQTVGAGLMTAMLITPAATAYLLTRRLERMILLAALIGAVSGVVGLYLSYYIQIASGAAMALATTLSFMVGWGISRWRTR